MSVFDSEKAEHRRERYHSVPIHSLQSLPTPGPANFENKFLHSMPCPPFRKLNQILLSLAQGVLESHTYSSNPL